VIDPRALGARLAALPVRLSGLRCRSGRVDLGDYPGGRPSTVLEVSGDGQAGFGEHVAFSDEEQQAFVHGVEGLLVAASGRVAEIVRPSGPSMQRAALESAVIDLAMRQAGLGLRELCGLAEGRLRWVSSFAACLDPAARARALAGEVKVDVDPRWDEAAMEALAGESVAILDFKEGGTPALATRLSAAFPTAIFEDPPLGGAHARVARDRSLVSATEVQAAVGRGEAINVKVPRLGGVLAALEALALAREGGVLAYFGGMFEVSPGREQARQLAALFCADAPNDLAPLAGGLTSVGPQSPSVIRLDGVGFGATCDWTAIHLR
jgi:L-alanine-DL-glutamate epimerase-like enolase superfamily enzyme